LQKLDLTDAANRKVEALSKGMSQRVQFIAAVVPRPELLILDEPFTGLDPVHADAMRKAVLELRDEGTTILFSTHDMNVAETLCDFLCMIFRGRKVLDGTLASIQDTYGNDTIRLRVEGGPSVLQTLPGVEALTDLGQMQVLRLRRDADPQEILGLVVSRTRVWSFEVAKPSLHDIFVRIAAPKESEGPHA
jgi:ABC-2 type transport system ATP-binding protein